MAEANSSNRFNLQFCISSILNLQCQILCYNVISLVDSWVPSTLIFVIHLPSRGCHWVGRRIILTRTVSVPFMELNSGAYAPLQGYALPNDKTKLLFVYSVSNGEATPPGIGLDLEEFSVIQLNGGSITGATTGLDVDFNLMSSAYGSLGT